MLQQLKELLEGATIISIKDLDKREAIVASQQKRMIKNIVFFIWE
jgi:hypothetical protein